MFLKCSLPGAYNYPQPTESAPQQSMQPPTAISTNQPQQYAAGQYAAPQQPQAEPQQQQQYAQYTAPQPVAQQPAGAAPQQMAGQVQPGSTPVQQVPTSAAQAHMYQVRRAVDSHHCANVAKPAESSDMMNI